MDYTRFYTPNTISDFLINQLNIEPPKAVVDICCGGCNLLHAVNKRWENTELIGADIVDTKVEDVKTVVSDGREYALKTKSRYSLVVANPPFVKVEKKNQFPGLYDIFGQNLNTSRLEVEMLLANLLLLKRNGILVIIMPVSFVLAQRYSKYRDWLAKNYYIQDIFKLPHELFGASKIKTYALIIQNSKSNGRLTSVHHVSQDTGKFVSKRIDSLKIFNDCWIDNQPYNKKTINIKRGNISSNQFEKTGKLVLHTSKICNDWAPSKRYVSKTPKNPVFVESGDIIVSRIGQSAGYFCIYSGSKAMISDCLFVIKDPDGIIASVIEGNQYNRIVRGVSTPYITQSDFISWYLSIV